MDSIKRPARDMGSDRPQCGVDPVSNVGWVDCRVLEIDRRTGERRDLNCPSDVMALYRAGDRIFATGSVSARNTKQVRIR